MRPHVRMIFLPVMLRLEPALLVLVWIMNLVVLEAHNMGITVTGVLLLQLT